MNNSHTLYNQVVRSKFFKMWITAIIFIFGLTASYSPLCASAESARQQVSSRAVQAERQMLHYNLRAAQEKTRTTREGMLVPSLRTSLSINQNNSTASTIFFFDDMESGSNGWIVASHTDSAAWHQTSIEANSPAHSWWAGIDGQGNYNTNTRVVERLISPAINLSGGVGNITLLFTEKFVTERGWDFCMVDVSTNGGTTWTHLRGGYGTSPSGDSRGWSVTSLDLTPFANQTINVSFLFDTGDSLFNAFPGWFVDNVAVFDQSGTISGTVYFDMNQNGLLKGEETGLSNREVNISGPVSVLTKTNDQGIFSVRLPLGSYQVSENPPPPWILTSSPTTWNIDLTTPDQIVNDVLFGNYRSGSVVRGTVFNDIDKDSTHDVGEPPRIGEYIELSDSIDEWEDEAYSDSSGRFNFLVLNSGSHHVRQYLDDSWISTVPGGNPAEYLVNVPPVDTLMGDLLFGSYFDSVPVDSAIIRGYVFNDLDHNGLQDEREPKLSQRVITLSLSGEFYDETVTDSSGAFAFGHLSPGTYAVRLNALYGWQQSYPDTFYEFTVSSGELKDSVLFGSYELATGTLRGTVFNDLNRNGQRDTLEPGLNGWTVSAKGPGSWSVDGITDTAGNYILNDVVEGPHVVSITLQWQWGQSSPPGSSYPIILGALETIDSLDFGVYALLPGSISGTVFNDLNGNAVRDSGEPGIANSQLRLEGDANGSTSTNDSGQYQFTGLWSGSYRVRSVLNTNWRQTLPPMLLPQLVSLGAEEDRTGTDFGLTFDSTFNIAFRTFLPESLALARDSKGKVGKSEKKKPYASEATFDLTAPIDGLTGLHVEFSQDIFPASLTVTHFSSSTPDARFRKWEFAFTGAETLSNGDHIVIFARGNKPKSLLISKYWWIKGAENPALGTTAVRGTAGVGRLLLRMPNTMNMLDEMYRRTGSLSSLTVGLGGAHSIYHIKPADVSKSLLDKHGMHVGPPRCLGVFATTLKPIGRATKILTPTKGNNIMFAEMLALKVNLSASELWITPPGLGYLIFEEDTANQFNGRSIYQIAGKIDSAMSSFDELSKTCGYDDVFFNEAYRTVRMIDSVFSSPFDTLTYGSEMYLKPSRNLSDVPFLHFDSSFSIVGMTKPRMGNFGQVPVEFQLEQNYPNPFNPTTTISFTLSQPSLVTVKIYNVIGQEVTTLLDRQEMEDGDQEVDFNANNLPSGVYFYHLRAEGISDKDDGIVAQTFTAVKKMLLIK
jgi:serine-aspartate repeat-containing protein C/D/E